MEQCLALMGGEDFTVTKVLYIVTFIQISKFF